VRLQILTHVNPFASGWKMQTLPSTYNPLWKQSVSNRFKSEKSVSQKMKSLLTCLLVKSSPMAQVGPPREHPLRVAPRSHLGWIARAFLVRRGATGQLSAFCRPPENSRILQSFSFH
jgi:hypothetical protein